MINKIARSTSKETSVNFTIVLRGSHMFTSKIVTCAASVWQRGYLSLLTCFDSTTLFTQVPTLAIFKTHNTTSSVYLFLFLFKFETNASNDKCLKHLFLTNIYIYSYEENYN
jgi:hypothetical protein